MASIEALIKISNIRIRVVKMAIKIRNSSSSSSHSNSIELNRKRIIKSRTITIYNSNSSSSREGMIIVTGRMIDINTLLVISTIKALSNMTIEIETMINNLIRRKARTTKIKEITTRNINHIRKVQAVIEAQLKGRIIEIVMLISNNNTIMRGKINTIGMISNTLINKRDNLEMMKGVINIIINIISNLKLQDQHLKDQCTLKAAANHLHITNQIMIIRRGKEIGIGIETTNRATINSSSSKIPLRTSMINLTRVVANTIREGMMLTIVEISIIIDHITTTTYITSNIHNLSSRATIKIAVININNKMIT